MIDQQFTDNLEEELIRFILRPGFKIDILLPNFKIFCRVHKQSTSHIFSSVIKLMKISFQNVIDYYIKSVMKDRVPKKNVIQQQVEKTILQNIKDWKNDEKLKQIQEVITELVITESSIFLFAITKTPDFYVQYLQSNFFDDLERINTFDEEFNINWLIKPITRDLCKFLKQVMQTAEGLLLCFLVDDIRDKIEEFTHFMNEIIVCFYIDSKGYLKEALEEFQKNTAQSGIINKFLILGLFQEVSHRSFDIVQNYLEFTVFQLSNIEVREQFARFVLFTFETLNLTSLDEDIESNIKKKYSKLLISMTGFKDINTQIQAIEQVLSQVMGKQNYIQINKIESKVDGRQGILVQAQMKSHQISYVLHRPKGCRMLIVTNANFVPNRWAYLQSTSTTSKEEKWQLRLHNQDEFETLEHVFQSQHFRKNVISMQGEYWNNKNLQATEEDVSRVVDNQLNYYEHNEYGSQREFQQFENQEFMQHQLQKPNILLTSAAGDIGSSLGSCLANINRYKSKKEFLKDFGSTAAINGSLTYLVSNTPVIGNMIAVGGFGYFAHRIYTNETASISSKNRQFEKLLIGTGAGVGSSIGGAIVGQALIPVPLLGALIGGFIGGLVGGTSSSILFELLNEHKAKDLVLKLEGLQDPSSGSWKVLKSTIELLGLSEQFFKQEIPLSILYDDQREWKWINMICYVFITIFYTQKEASDKKENKKKEKEKNIKLTHQLSKSVILDESDQQKNKEKPSKSVRSLELIDDIDDDEDDNTPLVIELAQGWLLKHKIRIQLALTNLERVCKIIINNL